MKTGEDRAKLIGCMETMKLETPQLRFLDGKITLRDRISVLAAQGILTAEEADELRFRSIAVNNLPMNVDAKDVKELDFGSAGLRAMGLGKYVNLKVLILRRNAFRTIQSVQGLFQMKQLEVLDLRENVLSSLKEILNMLENNELPFLQALGLAGNKFKKDYRQKILEGCKFLYERKSPLISIDDVEILPTELFAAAQANGTLKSMKNVQKFRFELAFMRRVPISVGSNYASLLELDLSNVGLELLNLDDFSGLKKLSLANNLLNNKTLVASQIATLTQLYYLNLRNNKLKNLDSLAKALTPLKELVDLNFLGNSCCGSLSRVEIGKRFDRLLDPSCPLLYLNDGELTVEERVDIAVMLGKKESDLFRLQFCVFLRNVNEQVTSLDLSKCGLRTLGGLQIFVNLVALDLSSNNISVFEKHVFAYMPKLKFLDLRNNVLDCSLLALTDALASCKQLNTLFILNALKDGSTNRRNQYLGFVFENLLACLKLDGHKRSVGDVLDEKTMEMLSGVKTGGNRASVSGVSRSQSSGGQSLEKKKRRSIRKVRGSVVPNQKLSSSSSALSPLVPRIPQIGGLHDSDGSDRESSPTSSSSGGRVSSGGRRVKSPKDRTGSMSPKLISPKGVVSSKNRGSSEALSASASPPPSTKKTHSRKKSLGKSPGRSGGSDDLIRPKHKRSGSTGTSKKSDVLAPASSPPPMASPSTKEKRGSVRKGHVRRGSTKGGGSSNTLGADDAMASSPPPQAAPKLVFNIEDLLQGSERKAQRESGAKEAEGADSDMSVDDQVVSSAADFLRSLDFGLSASSDPAAPAKNSDDEYAESDEDLWNDLSEELEVEEVEEKKNVDPRLILQELEMFRIGEGQSVELEEEELEEEEEGEQSRRERTGGFLDRFDLGTARGSSTARGTGGSLRGSNGSLRGNNMGSLKSKGSLRGNK
jgi:Leucine-rich repeat (LRR) protein